MDALLTLRGKIAGFPGYGEMSDRHRADEMVRAYLGEALARLRERLAPTGDAGERLDAAILRTDFTNPKVFGSFESASTDAGTVDRISRADLAAVELADRAEGVDAAALPAYIDEVSAALDVRDRAMEAAAG